MAKRIGKVPVVVGVCHGFVGNRMLAARGAEAEPLLLEGATPSQIDKAFTDFGWPMGPFQMGDLAGLDIGWRNRKAQGQTAVIADTLCEQGRFGQKTGRGFYLYESRRARAAPDPEVEALIAAKAASRASNARADRAPRRSSSARSIRWSTKARRSWKKASRPAPPTSMSSGSTATAFPIGKGGPMFWAGLEGAGQDHRAA